MLAGPQSREIEGVTYHVLPLPAGASLVVAARVLKMAAPAFSDVASLVAAAEAVNSALGALASGFMADLDPETVLYAAHAFAKVTSFEVGGAKLPLVSDKGGLFDEHFRGRFTALLKWLAFAASVSFPFVAKAVDAASAPAVTLPAAG